MSRVRAPAPCYTAAMRSRLVRALPSLLVPLVLVACKGRRSEPPEPGPEPVAGYGSLAWTEAEAAAPTPAIRPIEVCEHLARMVAAEFGDEAPPIDLRMLAECESDLAVEAGLRGTDNWNAIAGCVLAARTEADIDACDRRHPMPAQSGPAADEPGAGEPGVGERELQVCAHMIDIFMLESAAESGEVPQLTRADRDELERGCAESLSQEQPARGGADYERMLACIEQARSSEQLRACE